MKKFLFTLSVLTFFNSANAQNWTQVSNNILKSKNSNSEFNNSKVYSMDATNLKNKLASAPSSTSSQTGAVIDIPTSDGNIQKFMVWEASILSPKLQEKYPNIKSYVGKNLEDPSVYLRFSVTPLGFSSSIFRNDGNSDFIE
ncbi:MAG: secretion protein, partial [Algoriella sp.]